MRTSIRIFLVPLAMFATSAIADDSANPSEWICKVVSKGFGRSVGDTGCLEMNNQYARCYLDVTEECFKNGTGETRTVHRTIDYGCKTLIECASL